MRYINPRFTLLTYFTLYIVSGVVVAYSFCGKRIKKFYNA